MRQIAGAGFVLALAVAAMRIGGSGTGQTSPVAPTPRLSVHAEGERSVPNDSAVVATYRGNCSAFDPEETAETYPRDSNRGTAKTLIDQFFGLESGRQRASSTEGNSHDTAKAKKRLDSVPAVRLKNMTGVRFVLALAPDPRHTNLSLLFDREMVAVQQAAQDEGYNYNSSWLPWTTESTAFTHIADQQQLEALTEAREACPGVLLFRRGVSPSSVVDSKPSHAYDSALVVLVVGEQPTGGINETQWSNAIAFLNRNASVYENKAFSTTSGGDAKEPELEDRKFRLIGPTFTGSLPSLERALLRFKALPLSASVAGGDGGNGMETQQIFPSQQSYIQVLGTSVRGCPVIRWFQQKLYQDFGNHAAFGSLEENDSLQIYDFLNYLNSQGTKISDVAILSEDETAYANNLASPVSAPGSTSDPGSRPPGLCDFAYDYAVRPVRLSYPRDISALRSAYEKQSVFTGATRSGHSVLDDAAELTGDSSGASDTIPTFGGGMIPVNQEAVLYGIVSNLRSHHSRYLMLRCTNPLDFLFLIRFFHRAYPEGRIVTVGSDLFFRREIDTTEFRGVLALSSYSLLPREQHWSHLSQSSPGARTVTHTHRIPESDQESAYLAARYLFDRRASAAMPSPLPGSVEPLLLLPFKENLPDFADPFWLHKPDEPLFRIQPPVWLSVVGRDGYWPIAVLNPETTPNRCLDKVSDSVCPQTAPAGSTPPSTIVRVDGSQPARQGAVIAHYDLGQTDSHESSGQFDGSLLFKMDRPWELCAILACLLIAYQLFGVSHGRENTSFGLLAPFRRIATPSHGVLIGINSALALSLLSTLLTVVVAIPHYSKDLDACLVLGVFGALWLMVHIAFFTLLAGSGKAGRSPSQWAFGILSAVYDLALAASFFLGLNSARVMPFFYRMSHLTEGVSPLVPPLFLMAGYYLWTWQALAGNSMLCCGRPLLPELARPEFPAGDKPFRRYWESHWYYRLLGLPTHVADPAPCNVLPQARFRISHEMGKRIIKVAAPLCLDPQVILLPIGLFFSAVLYAVFYGIPLLSLEGLHYDQILNCLLLLAFVLTIAEAARFFMTWKELQRLLLALSRLRLRRTLARLHAIDASSLWTVSGNVQRVQYHFFAQQLDAVKRLAMLPGGDLPSVLKARRYGIDFAETSASRIGTGPVWENSLVVHAGKDKSGKQDKPPIYIREVFNEAVAEVLNKLFVHWDSETTSLCLKTAHKKQEDPEDESERTKLEIELTEELLVRTQEEFVCFHYIAFIQNILARMRTMILSMIFLFVSVCFSISFYPFVPRTGISMWMLINLVLIASAVVYVYAGMERDATLSSLTNTRPGSLGTDFYIKTATFLAGPVLGLLTTQFPAISESLLSILQPGLDALK